MIICPELQTVFILVPRTGSGSLYREILRVYPKSMLLYRHMEADGVPQGYDRWKRVGFVRHPVARLHSLYKFMQRFGGGTRTSNTSGASIDTLRVRKQVEGRTFVEWLQQNDQPWTMPCDVNGAGGWWPTLSKRDPAPENKRSQWSYLRPDLGTVVYRFEDLPQHMAEWGLAPAHENKTPPSSGHIDLEAYTHIHKFCTWDFEQGCSYK